MTTELTPPYFVLAAVKRVYLDLPTLVGQSAWIEIQTQIDAFIRILESESNAEIASQLLELLGQYEPSRHRMIDEIKVQEVVYANIVEQMQRIASDLKIAPDFVEGMAAAVMARFHWQFDPITLPKPDENVHERSISLTEGDLSNVKSVKFKNMKLDLGDFSKIGAGFMATAAGIITAPAIPLVLQLLVVGGILSTISALHDTMKIELSEQDASVFLGMIQAIGNMPGAGLSEATIVASTNTVREGFGLEPLKEIQVRLSLSKLERIESIEKTNNYYHIIERYSVKK